MTDNIYEWFAEQFVSHAKVVLDSTQEEEDNE